MWVDNYKALNEFEISFTPYTLIIGNNAAGKSSVMEVVDFLAGSVKESFDIILERRQLTVQNIISRLKNSSRIYFGCEIELETGDRKKILKWELQIKAVISKNTMVLEKEQVADKEDGMVYLEFDWFRERLKNFYPGEILLNLSSQEIFQAFYDDFCDAVKEI